MEQQDKAMLELVGRVREEFAQVKEATDKRHAELQSKYITKHQELCRRLELEPVHRKPDESKPNTTQR